MTDEEHAQFVLNEYRYSEASDPSVKSRHPKAREIQIDTSLSGNWAQWIADQILAENTDPKVLECSIEEIWTPSKFVTGPPRYTVTFAKHGIIDRPMKVVGFEAILEEGKTRIQLRG